MLAWEVIIRNTTPRTRAHLCKCNKWFEKFTIEVSREANINIVLPVHDHIMFWYFRMQRRAAKYIHLDRRGCVTSAYNGYTNMSYHQDYHLMVRTKPKPQSISMLCLYGHADVIAVMLPMRSYTTKKIIKIVCVLLYRGLLDITRDFVKKNKIYHEIFNFVYAYVTMWMPRCVGFVRSLASDIVLDEHKIGLCVDALTGKQFNIHHSHGAWLPHAIAFGGNVDMIKKVEKCPSGLIYDIWDAYVDGKISFEMFDYVARYDTPSTGICAGDQYATMSKELVDYVFSIVDMSQLLSDIGVCEFMKEALRRCGKTSLTYMQQHTLALEITDMMMHNYDGISFGIELLTMLIKISDNKDDLLQEISDEVDGVLDESIIEQLSDI